MWSSSFRLALRSLRRNRGFAFLNVGGLALGLACVLLIVLYVQDERAVDGFHERADRIVRVDMDVIKDGEVDPSSNTPGVLGPALAERMPEVEAAVRFTHADPVLRVDGTPHEAERMYFADPEVFAVFTYPLTEGDPATALAAPGQIVLTAPHAARLFGSAPALGQTVGWKDRTLTVAGVLADVPRQTHLPFDGLISLATAEDPGWFYDNWFSVGFATYALLRPGVPPAAFDAALPAFVEAAAGEAMIEEGERLALHARPLPTLYLTVDMGMGEFGNATTLDILLLVALFVLLVAAVNFTNLATARSLDRAREVGVRKSLGAGRGGLAAQFLVEAVVLSGLALALAVVVAALAMPAFRELSGKPLSLADLGPGWLGLAALAVVTGLAAGAYPALVLSGFRPAEVLKGRFATSARGQGLRQGLVVVQFGISVALIAATVIVFTQLRYMQSQDLGLDLGGETSQLVVLPIMGDSSVVARLAQVRARLNAVPGVLGTTASLTAPTFGTYSAGGTTVDGPDGPGPEFSTAVFLADTAYVGVYGLDLLAGRAPRGLPPGAPDDAPREFVLSETAARAAGFARADAIDPTILGAPAQFWGIEGTVVGVMADLHVEGLQTAVEPVLLTVDEGTILPPNTLTLRVSTAGLPATLAAVETAWSEVAPSRPFTYSFLDEDFAEQYVSELRFGRLFGVFSGLAIGIACVGLFGLAAHAAAQRTKEIGVRRVLGATVGQIVVLLSRNVVALVAAGVAVGAPVVVWGMSRWLDGFATRIALGWAPFALATAVVLTVAVLTVGGHALRAALADPVRALRSE